MPEYHILNGDALNNQLPTHLSGTRIILRECLVDGPVEGETLDALCSTRAKFISEGYGETEAGYYEHSAKELKRITDIPEESIVNLWFEEDLFCQVNLWFTLWLLEKKNISLFLVRPPAHTPYGFSGVAPQELPDLLNDKTVIHNASAWSKLWHFYQRQDTTALLSQADVLQADFPFMVPAVKAYIESIPSATSPGRPVETLQDIMQSLDTTSFGPVFKEFCKREAIYGYGDLQVKRLYDTLIAPDK